jgi:hypothetical protein
MIRQKIKKLISAVSAYKHLLFLICVIGVLIDVFFLKFTSDFLIFLLTALWVLVVKLYKFEGRVSVAVALGFLVLCPFLLIFKKEAIAEKAAIWTYMFLVVGAIQMFIEVKKEKR